MAVITNLGPCGCCGGGVPCQCGVPPGTPTTLYVTLINESNCPCLDEITFVITYGSGEFGGWGGSYESAGCILNEVTRTTVFELMCNSSGGASPGGMLFYARGNLLFEDYDGCYFNYGPGGSLGTVVSESCDPFYLEVSGVGLFYTFSRPAPQYGNCCDPQVEFDPENGLPIGTTPSRITVIISEIPP